MKKHLSFDNSLTSQFHDIRDRINALDIPSIVYLGITLDKKSFRVAELGGGEMYLHNLVKVTTNPALAIAKFVQKHAQKRDIKYTGATIKDGKMIAELLGKLWLDSDIVPLIPHGRHWNINPASLATFTSRHFEGNIYKVDITKKNEVLTHDLASLDNYKNLCQDLIFDSLIKLANQFKGKKISFFSSTPQGGGVAIMRHALMRLFKLLNIEAHWYVLEPYKEAFEITKDKFHNVLQGVTDSTISQEDKDLYMTWMEQNAVLFKETIKNSDVCVIDDPQPCGLIPFFKTCNPNIKIIYRSHIHIDTEKLKSPNSNSASVWNFLRQFIKLADIFVSHPIPSFVPSDINMDKVVFMPATYDPLDGLNKDLTYNQMKYYMKLFNKYLLESGQETLDFKRPYIIQIARFDPSKGIPDVLEAYRLMRKMYKKNPPQLVLAGNGSIDDPDTGPIYNLTLETMRKEPYVQFAKDVKIAILPHIDQILNTLLTKAYIVLQLSHRDGFEVKVTEALRRGKPVIAYKTGGIQLQIWNGLNGYLVERIGDIHSVSKHIVSFLERPTLYKKFSDNARNNFRRDCDTIHSAIYWLFLANKILLRDYFKTNGLDIISLLRQEFPKAF